MLNRIHPYDKTFDCLKQEGPPLQTNACVLHMSFQIKTRVLRIELKECTGLFTNYVLEGEHAI
jgi:hypothetical protein